MKVEYKDKNVEITFYDTWYNQFDSLDLLEIMKLINNFKEKEENKK